MKLKMFWYSDSRHGKLSGTELISNRVEAWPRIFIRSLLWTMKSGRTTRFGCDFCSNMDGAFPLFEGVFGKCLKKYINSKSLGFSTINETKSYFGVFGAFLEGVFAPRHGLALFFGVFMISASRSSSLSEVCSPLDPSDSDSELLGGLYCCSIIFAVA